MPGFKYVNFCKCAKALNMHWDGIMERFEIFKDSEYARFLHKQTLVKVMNMAEYAL